MDNTSKATSKEESTTMMEQEEASLSESFRSLVSTATTQSERPTDLLEEHQWSSTSIGDQIEYQAANISAEELTSSQKRRVRFDSITFYEFDTIMGDNPAVREGCPIALGDKLLRSKEVAVDRYERSRRPRQSRHSLYIPTEKRASILLKQGYDLMEIVQTVMEVDEIRKSRRLNMRIKGWEKLNLAIDTAGKSLRKKVLRKDAKPNTIQARTA